MYVSDICPGPFKCQVTRQKNAQLLYMYGKVAIGYTAKKSEQDTDRSDAEGVTALHNTQYYNSKHVDHTCNQNTPSEIPERIGFFQMSRSHP